MKTTALVLCGIVLGSIVARDAHAQPLVIGCADGTREGFGDRALYPLIAACGGAWTRPGVFHEAPICAREAGNDGLNEDGYDCNVEDLCAGGWHVCHGPDDIEVRTAGNGCRDAVAADYLGVGAFFVTRTSGAGVGQCDEVVNGFPSNYNDLFGCGNMGGRPTIATGPGSCSPLDRFSNNLCSGLQSATTYNGTPATAYGYGSADWAWYCGQSTTTESQNAYKAFPDRQGGVLCCKDADDELPELCDNGIDNDADGDTDETQFDADGVLDYVGGACVQANGQPGSIECNGAGGWVCGPSLTQSCCLPAGDCLERTPDACMSAGGDPGGVGTRCRDVACRPDPCARDGADCDDGDACTQDDVCMGGVCSGTIARCDDLDPCTDDACVDGACVSVMNTAPCDDGDSCTSKDSCREGICSGNALLCDDGNPCTDDACVDGACVATNNTSPCDDGDACSGGDVCQAGVCQAGVTPLCAPECVLGDVDGDTICDDDDTCIDRDGDGFGVGSCAPDCNDDVAACTTDCTTDNDGGDGNGVPDCEEPPCADGDGDGYGVGDACAGPDCDDGVAACAADCSDTDGDGRMDCVDSDDDDDDLSDDIERLEGTDPKRPDSDGDGLTDSAEVILYGTDPTNADSDGDGASDGAEVAANADPNDASDGPAPATAKDAGCASGPSALWAIFALLCYARLFGLSRDTG